MSPTAVAARARVARLSCHRRHPCRMLAVLRRHSAAAHEATRGGRVFDLRPRPDAACPRALADPRIRGGERHAALLLRSGASGRCAEVSRACLHGGGEGPLLAMAVSCRGSCAEARRPVRRRARGEAAHHSRPRQISQERRHGLGDQLDRARCPGREVLRRPPGPECGGHALSGDQPLLCRRRGGARPSTYRAFSTIPTTSQTRARTRN